MVDSKKVTEDREIGRRQEKQTGRGGSEELDIVHILRRSSHAHGTVCRQQDRGNSLGQAPVAQAC